MSRDGFKLLVKHSDECWLGGKNPVVTDHFPFVLHDGHEFSRKRNGNAGGGRMFHRFRCNDPDCRAIMLVRCDVLSDWIANG